MRRTRIFIAVGLAGLVVVAPAHGATGTDVAALQVALRAHGLYGGTIDGDAGPATRAGVRAFQARRGLAASGIAGPATRRALGRRGRPRYGSRTIASGAIGWDVAALQFNLAWHGFPSGAFDGRFGPRTEAAVRRFQAWASLDIDGLAGPATFRALRRPFPSCPLSFARPVAGPRGDGFGPRGNRFHTGIDFPVGYGTPVLAARSGVVSFAGPSSGGYGKLVIVAHRGGVTSWYAHLQRVRVTAGESVGLGERVGDVGSSGHSTGPHLHFEVRVRGAAVAPPL